MIKIAKSTKKFMPKSASSFWMDESLFDYNQRKYDSGKDYLKLAGYQRVIGNFVKILTNKNRKVCIDAFSLKVNFFRLNFNSLLKRSTVSVKTIRISRHELNVKRLKIQKNSTNIWRINIFKQLFWKTENVEIEH